MNIDTSNFGYSDKLSFVAVWVGSEPVKKFLLEFFPYDQTLQLKYFQTAKYFLKRIQLDTVSSWDIYLGNTLIVFHRLIQILDYANGFTKELYGPTQEEAVMLVKPLIKYYQYGDIIGRLEESFQIINMRMCKLSREDGKKMFKNVADVTVVPALIDHIISGPCLAIQLRALNCRKILSDLVGPVIPDVARKVSPNSLRAIYGVDRQTNGFHITDSQEQTEEEIQTFFKGVDGYIPVPCAIFKNTALCVIKPHAVQQKRVGEIIKYITDNKFTITMMQIFYFKEEEMDDFLEAYKGIVDNFFNFAESFLRGPALILEVGSRDPDLNVFEAFRDFTGLRNPDINNRLKPFTLRAKFGEDKYHNAVYCADVESAVVESLEFFFKILQ